jgi:hypothetical protein
MNLRRFVASAVALLAAASYAPPPAAAASPNYPHINVTDFLRGLQYISNRTAREQAWAWAASHMDAIEVDGASFAQEMVKRNATIKPWRYQLDLTGCQHKSCKSTFAVDTTVESLPESYYLHFSETTTLNFVRLDGTVDRQVTIPGCPAGTAVTKACRVQLWMWEDTRWVFNPNDPGFQTWQANRLLGSLGAGVFGTFLDEHAAWVTDAWYWGRQTKPVSGGGVRELGGAKPNSPAAVSAYMPMVVNWLAVLRVKAKAQGKFVMPNLSLESTDKWGTDQALAAGGVSTEFLHRPDAFDGGSDHFERYIKLVQDLMAIGGVADLAGTLCYTGPSGYTAGNYSTSAARYRMWRLAAYYLVREGPGQTGTAYFNPGLCTRNWPTDPLGWTKEWLKAYERDFGSPAGEPYLFKKGSYTAGTKTCGYKVHARPYSGGLVLVRTKDAWNCTAWGDDSAITLTLPRSMRLLNDDGTVSAASSSVRIRNGEAAILVN